MFTTSKRGSAKTLLAVSAVFVGALLTGCSDDSSAASSDSDKKSASPKSGFDQALEHAKCMRENGVPDYPDPKQDANGRVNISPGQGVDPSSQDFKDAMQACRDLAPQGQGGQNGGGDIDPAKVSEWAKCMRENGLPKFPDPEVKGNELTINVAEAGIKPNDPEFSKAQQACQDKFPGGMMRLQGPGPGGSE
ncbi:hypothetical protein ACWGJ2_20740 [Streptomyces sp. NPDC054796]|uniref:Lipoprotein n=1 Tax=Streptomyces daliensis TaxID=299421 RepID=A0A8T4IIS5_9ACTN|nr:hypothetical protein [Streptomyces daliensis]